jgi:hypothetical protein
MAKTTAINTVTPTGPIDCACVIHGDAYPWIYVERLYNMLNRHISVGINMHVYTEADRPVPAPMIKHELTDWGIGGPRRSWWYKLQLFNSKHHAGPLLYFDLDTVIVKNIDWIWNLPLKYFWTVQDFKYLWRPAHQGVNSSIMWWDTRVYDHVWNNFKLQDLPTLIKKHTGDQDYINIAVDNSLVRFLDTNKVKSWRWQCFDGGYNFKQRTYQNPGSGTWLTADTSVVIFHGKPKPADLVDPVVKMHWK